MATTTTVPSAGIAGEPTGNAARNAIREASGQGGVGFRYMLAKATLESGMQSGAQSRTSSASGLFQFTRSTWLSLVRDHGARHGLGELAKAVKTRPDGSVHVEDPATRNRILALRRDPKAAASMTVEYAKQNAAYLRSRLGREVNDLDLYAAHVFGPAGAARLLKAVVDEGDRPAAGLLKGAARSNHALFYERNGKAKSAQTVFASLARRLHEASSTVQVAEAGAAAQPLGANPKLLAQLSTAVG